MTWWFVAFAILVVAAAVVTVALLRRRDRRAIAAQEAQIEARVWEKFQQERDELEASVERTKGAFVEAVSHELRTPLAVVLGFALTLDHRWEALDEDRARMYVERLSLSAQRLDQLLADLLDVRRLWLGVVEAHPREVDVAFILRDVVERADPKGRQVEVEAEEARIIVDPGMFERTVEILLANAMKHTPEGTNVWIRLRREGEGAVLGVHDQGSGVAEQHLEDIFEPFIKADPKRDSPGTGVGLALVAGYAALHEGRAWVENREGRGAAFKVLFPGRHPKRTRLEAPPWLVARRPEEG